MSHNPARAQVDVIYWRVQRELCISINLSPARPPPTADRTEWFCSETQAADTDTALVVFAGSEAGSLKFMHVCNERCATGLLFVRRAAFILQV